MKAKKLLIILTCIYFVLANILFTVKAIEIDDDDTVRRCFVLAANGGTDMEAFYEYKINNDGPNTCTIVGYKGNFYSNIVPETLDGYIITRIGDGAFKDINKITGGFTLPSTVISIGNEAFSGCTLMTSVTLSNKTASIGNNAFENCTSLMKINIDNVETIGNEAFKGCTKLNSLTFKNKIKSIGSKAFEKCGAAELKFTSTTAPQVQDDTFANFAGKVILPLINDDYAGIAWTGSYVNGVAVLGDLDDNGVVDANDASLVLEKYKAESATKADLDVADLDRNGVLDANDASLILEIYKTTE